MVSTQKSAQLGRRSVVRGAAWAVPAVGIGAAAPAIAASPVNTPIYRNSCSGISYAYTSACQVSYTINALTTTTDPNAANGYWLDSDVATVGAVSNLKYSVTTTQCGLTWTVTQVSGDLAKCCLGAPGAGSLSKDKGLSDRWPSHTLPPIRSTRVP